MPKKFTLALTSKYQPPVVVPAGIVTGPTCSVDSVVLETAIVIDALKFSTSSSEICPFSASRKLWAG